MSGRDSRWAWMRDASRRLFAELEPGAEVVAMSVIVAIPETEEILAYVTRSSLGRTVVPVVVTDAEGFAAAAQAQVGKTVEMLGEL